jgi:MFS transporter, FHS family, L-fucose permease
MLIKNGSLLKYQGRSFLIPFVLLCSLFFMWGLANNMTDTLLAAFKKIMSMSDFETSWIQFAFYGSYFCLAIPAAIFIKKYTYKSGILLGLGLFILGAFLFYPASITRVYGHFLGALFILAGGLSVLETTANSYIIILGSPETATRRLNLAQSFNPIGSISGVLISSLFILSELNQASVHDRVAMSADQLAKIQSAELEAVMLPYVGVALFLILLWLFIAFAKMPRASDESKEINFIPTFKRLFKNRNYRMGVFAQFFYVGAQIGVWSFTIRYVMQELKLNEAEAADYYIASLVVFGISRFVFTALMKYFKPGNLLAFSSLLALISSLFVIFGNGYFAVFSLISVSAFMSLMFPTIFGLAVHGLGSDTKIGGSGLIMAILGGAIMTIIQGKISDLAGDIHLSYFVPLCCFIFIFYYGFKSRNLYKHQAHTN